MADTQVATPGSFWCAVKSSPDCHKEIHLLASMSAAQDFDAMEKLGWKRTTNGWACPPCLAYKEEASSGSC